MSYNTDDIIVRLRKFLTMEDHPGDVAFLEAIEEAADEIERLRQLIPGEV
jgi:hypothetical protein